ncbi:DUF6624 domain-containing protein [Streptomyces sp. NPDC050535]|uniref:DUF6624 domain-containing protein n=1 Tax=Streptomyces sp. NPDC050535 TaxID=3365626 RepID=UPI0037AE268A
MTTPAPPPTARPLTRAVHRPLRGDLGLELLRCKWRLHEAPTSPPPASEEAVAAVLAASAEILRTIMMEHGWPGYTLVGKDAARVAWHIAHNCPDIELQAEAQRLLEAAVLAGDADPDHYALLTDRLCAQRGRPQRFGTQYVQHRINGLVLYPIADLEGLDERRAALGLEAHAQYDARTRNDTVLSEPVGPRL